MPSQFSIVVSDDGAGGVTVYKRDLIKVLKAGDTVKWTNASSFMTIYVQCFQKLGDQYDPGSTPPAPDPNAPCLQPFPYIVDTATTPVSMPLPLAITRTPTAPGSSADYQLDPAYTIPGRYVMVAYLVGVQQASATDCASASQQFGKDPFFIFEK